MPGFNQQGPNGEGPLTGRGLGVCASRRSMDRRNVPPYAGLGLGRRYGGRPGMGMGRGPGRNRAAFFQPQADTGSTDIDALKTLLESTQRTMETLSNRLDALEKAK